jgi:hypothetical protein
MVIVNLWNLEIFKIVPILFMKKRFFFLPVQRTGMCATHILKYFFRWRELILSCVKLNFPYVSSHLLIRFQKIQNFARI